ncbi:MAG: hypothetical protein M1819_005817 [Sarea resinae]|nr:MAG: hypothetical protein M1819_005817 [Sarea resinae]
MDSTSESPLLSFDTFHNVIGGQLRGAPRTYSGTNPVNKKTLWEAPVATSQDVDDAVAAAQEAFPAWSATEYATRTGLLEDFAKLYLAHSSQLTELLVAETESKTPLAASNVLTLIQTQFAAIEVQWAVQWIRQPASVTWPVERIEDDEKVATTRYEPLGVVAAICPWNFPLMLGDMILPCNRKDCPRLSRWQLCNFETIVSNQHNSGSARINQVFLNRPFTPYTGLKLIELAQQIFPPGVVQALGGDEKLGPLLVEHPGIQKISFTGSTETGKKIMQSGAKTLKKLTLELGGNDAAIVLSDADINKVAPQVAMGVWFNAGQTCIAIKRIYIHHTIYSDFLRALVEFTKTLRVGSLPAPNDPRPAMIGPIQNSMQFDKLQDLIKDCKENGYTFALGGSESGDLTTEALREGFFIPPQILDNPPSESRIVAEEQFGPMVPCNPFSTIEEAIEAVNSTQTGLSASIWSADTKVAQEIADKVDVGSVYVNGPSRPYPEVPFSGHKQSGIGVEYGLPGLLQFCQPKAVISYK